MSVFRILFSFGCQFCIKKNERAFCIKRAHVLSGTNGRLGTDAVKVPVNDDSDRNITLKFEDL